MSAPGPDGVVCGNGCDRWSFDPDCPQHGRPAGVERAIEWLKENGMELLPWQAEVFRKLALHDGPIRIECPR